MSAKQCDDGRGVYEDERVCDDDKRRTRSRTRRTAFAAFLRAGDIVAYLQEDARDNGQDSGCIGETVRDRY